MSAGDLWRQFQARNRLILSEVTQLQSELAREGKLIKPLPIFPKTRSNTIVAIVFWLLVGFVAIALWSLIKAGR